MALQGPFEKGEDDGGGFLIVPSMTGAFEHMQGGIHACFLQSVMKNNAFLDGNHIIHFSVNNEKRRGVFSDVAQRADQSGQIRPLFNRPTQILLRHLV